VRNPAPTPLPRTAAALAAHAPRRVPAWLVWSFAIAVVLTYVGLLGHFPLNEPDEPRYGEIPREMLVLHDWVTPHLNFVKYFEKPPLVYWLNAATFKVFGTSEFAVRLWPALFALLGIGAAFALGRAMFDPWVGYLAAAILATSPFYFGLSQIVILDMPLSILMSVALGAFWFAYAAGDRGRRRPWLLLLYAATALAVLTKGPVAVVLEGGVIVGFLVLRGELRALRWAVSPLGIALFMAVAMPWFVLVSRRNPEFVDFFIIKQHVARFLTPDEHQEGVWFFVPVVLFGMLPWTLFVLCAPYRLGRFARDVLYRRVSVGTLYCVVWAGVVFAFFSLSGSKLATYVLPMFCPLAVLAGRFFDRLIRDGDAAVLRRGNRGLLIAAGLVLVAAFVTAQVSDNWRVGVIVPRAYGGAALLATVAAWALRCVRRNALAASLAPLLFGMLVVQLVAISGRQVAAQYRPLGLVVRAHAQPDDLVIDYRHYIQGVTFYGQRRTIMVGGRGELDFGSRQGDQRAFFWDTDEQLLEAWASGRRAFLIINRSELEAIRRQLHPVPRQIAAHGKKVIVVNF